MNDDLNPIELNSISQLIPLAKDGNDVAQNEICRQVQDYLQIMATKQLDVALRRKINPSDIVQQTMTRMVNGFDEFQGATPAEFFGWLNQILRNQIQGNRRDFHRKKRDIKRETDFVDADGNSNSPSIKDAQLTPSSTAIKQEKIRRFHQALARLPEEYAEVIRLRSLQELSFKEVAERMNRSYDATTKIWYRAIVKFQEVLDGLDESIQ